MSNENFRKFRILCDMDDVLENLVPCWLAVLEFFQRKNPDFVPKKPEEITDWDITKFFPMLTTEQVFAPLNTAIVWDLLEPIPGAARVLEKFNAMEDVDLRILTSTHYFSVVQKREFLREHFPFLRWNQVIIASEKQYCIGDVLIDDGIKNLIGDPKPCYKGILFDAPHNGSFDETQTDHIVRAHGWDEVEKILDSMLEKHREVNNK